jgi:HEAT repeat protein
MYRTSGLILAGVFVAFGSQTRRTPIIVSTLSAELPVATALAQAAAANASAPAQDVAAVLAAARGVAPLICAFAAQSLGNGGWGWYDAPTSPVASDVAQRIRDMGREKLGASDVRLLLDSLSSTDACVRELSVRLLGRQRDTTIVVGLVERLGSRTPETREVAALGLGAIGAKSAVDPLVRTLRDAAPGVRANSAWALGHIQDGRALRPIMDLLRDDVAQVREAAAVAVGRIDSSSAVEALIVSPGGSEPLTTDHVYGAAARGAQRGGCADRGAASGRHSSTRDGSVGVRHHAEHDRRRRGSSAR